MEQTPNKKVNSEEENSPPAPARIRTQNLSIVPLVEFMYLVFTRMPGGVTVDNSDLCRCAPCLSSAIISLRLLILSITSPALYQQAIPAPENGGRE